MKKLFTFIIIGLCVSTAYGRGGKTSQAPARKQKLSTGENIENAINSKVSSTTAQGQYDEIAEATTTLKTEANQEILDRIAGDNALANSTTTLQGNIISEEVDRISADNDIANSTTTLQENIDSEETARISTDNALAISTTALDNAKVNRFGDTMTGHLVVNSTVSAYAVVTSTVITDLVKVSTIHFQNDNIVIKGGNGSINIGDTLGNSYGTTFSNSGINIGSDTYSNNQGSINIGYLSFDNCDNSVNLGWHTYENSTASINMGVQAQKNGSMSVNLGRESSNNEEESVNTGYFSGDNGQWSSNYGAVSTQNEEYSTSAGAYTATNEKYSANLGYYIIGTKPYGVSLGAYSVASTSSVAVGHKTEANANRCVALGAGCVNNATETVKIADGYTFVADNIDASTGTFDIIYVSSIAGGSDINMVDPIHINIPTAKAMTLGNGSATDYYILFNANANDGTITWDEDFPPDGKFVMSCGLEVCGTIHGDILCTEKIGTAECSGEHSYPYLTVSTHTYIDGNLGVGTYDISPYKFRVVDGMTGLDGHLHIFGDGSTGSKHIKFYTNDNVASGQWGAINVVGIDPNAYMKFDQSWDRFVFDSTAKIGIGVTYPVGNFQIHNSTFIVRDGKVGIGNNNPQVDLDIAGKIALATDLDILSSPVKSGIIGIDSNFDVYVSTGIGTGAWVKIGSQ